MSSSGLNNIFNNNVNDIRAVYDTIGENSQNKPLLQHNFHRRQNSENRMQHQFDDQQSPTNIEELKHKMHKKKRRDFLAQVLNNKEKLEQSHLQRLSEITQTDEKRIEKLKEFDVYLK